MAGTPLLGIRRLHERFAVKPIDCDVHPAVPGMHALLPYLEEYWRDRSIERGIEGARQHQLSAERADLRAPRLPRRRAAAGERCGALGAQVFDRWGAGIAIRNCLYGVQRCSTRTWRRPSPARSTTGSPEEWLDRDPRLRASIVVPLQNVEFAVEEIERCAADPRFVQMLVLAMGEMPLGRRQFWPIYAAAERHGLPIGIHAGSAYRHPVTALGWPTYYVEDYCQPVAGLPVTDREPHLRRRICQAPQAQGGADRIRRDLGAGVSVAALQVLARAAHRDPVGRPLAARRSSATISA